MQNIIPVASDQAMIASSTVLCSAHALPLPTDAPRSYWRNLSFTLFTTSFIRFKAWADVCVFSRDPRMFPGPYGSDIVRFKSLTTMVECSQVQSYCLPRWSISVCANCETFFPNIFSLFLAASIALFKRSFTTVWVGHVSF